MQSDRWPDFRPLTGGPAAEDTETIMVTQKANASQVMTASQALRSQVSNSLAHTLPSPAQNRTRQEWIGPVTNPLLAARGVDHGNPGGDSEMASNPLVKPGGVYASDTESVTEDDSASRISLQSDVRFALHHMDYEVVAPDEEAQEARLASLRAVASIPLNPGWS